MSTASTRFLADAKAAGRRWPDRRRSAARGGQPNCACRRSKRGSTSSAWRRRRPTTARLPAVLANTSGFVYYVSITGITGAATPDSAQVGGRRGAHQTAHHLCRSRSASASRTPPARRRSPTCRWRRGRLGACRCAAAVARCRGPARRPQTVAAVTRPRRRDRQRRPSGARRRRAEISRIIAVAEWRSL